MFLQFDISPKPKKPAPKKQPEPEELVLSLAPFTQVPRICFENVKVGDVASKFLVVKNPTNQKIEVSITKCPPVDRYVSFGWGSAILESQTEQVLEIQWAPKEEGSWRDSFMLEGGKRVKKEVPLVYSAIIPKKTNVRSKVNVKKSTLRLINKTKTSPVHAQKIQKRSTLPVVKNLPTFSITSPENQSKENRPPLREVDVSYECKRETYTLMQSNELRRKFMEICEENFEDSLENISPEKNEILPLQKRHENVLTEKDMNLQQKLMSNFNFSRIEPSTPINLFIPSVCSTEEKSFTKNLTFNCPSEKRNLSGGTYIVSPTDKPGTDNISRGNISSETYVKGNLSTGTFTVDKSISPEPSPPSWKEQPRNLFSSNLNTNSEFSSLQSYLNQQENFSRTLLPQIQEESSILATPLGDYSIKKRSHAEELGTPTPNRFNQSKVSPNTQDRLRFKNTWSKRSAVNVRLSMKAVPKNLRELVQTEMKILETEKESVVLHDPEQKFFEVSKPILLPGMNIDPFIIGTHFYDPKWVHEQEQQFKKWLNALLTPPQELTANSEGESLDVAKLWKECKTKNIANAPSRETVSLRYHTKGRLNSLRKAAMELFQNREVNQVLAKVCAIIENNKLVIRADKNIHQDLGLQHEIMTLFLSYHPLWLRIGLETVYGFTIPLASNSDLIGLSRFIMDHFFKDPFTLKKHKVTFSKEYGVDIKKHILKKFLMLIYILDQAKQRKLIPHDPCLFCKNAQIKESREVILKFSRELLSSIGDVTKVLKHSAGYILSHKQTYIHEYDFAIECLGTDLRDGVRLTKVMELILLKENLLKELRVPPVCKLQKIHNTKVAFEALKSSGFEILHEIIPKDIVDGHKEKTLSFLWQIINKFQAPLFIKASITIQKWWRSLPIVIKRRRLAQLYNMKIEAATKIQRFYRNSKLSKKLLLFATVLKQYQEFKQREQAVIKMQAQIRGYLIRKRYTEIQNATLLIQNRIKATITMRRQREKYLRLRNATILIQQRFRATILMRTYRNEYLSLRNATICLQSHYKAKVLMNTARNEYLKIKDATITIQKWYKSSKLIKEHRDQFLQVRKSAIVIQSYFRGYILMKKQRDEYLRIRNAAICIQTNLKAHLAMKELRGKYLALKKATICVQQKFRARKLHGEERSRYIEIKKSTITIQTYFRSFILMKKQRTEYLQIRKSTICIQRYIKANLLMKRQRTEYLSLKKASICLQQHFRAKTSMKEDRSKFLQIRQATICLQQRYRANKLMKKQRKEYLLLKNTTVMIQNRFRANILAKKQRSEYIALRKSTIIIQTNFKAVLLMKKERESFLKLRNATICLQQHFRANNLMKKQRKEFLLLKNTTVNIQNRFRANILAKKQRSEYLALRKSTITIQTHFKAVLLMKKERESFLKLRNATICLQQYFRANNLMKKQRNEFLLLKNTTVTIQNRFRANLLAKKQRSEYVTLRKAAITIQTHLRAFLLMREERETFTRLRKATISIQQHYKALKLMKIQRNRYELMKKSAINIQRWYRAASMMKTNRNDYHQLRKATICIQTYFKATLLMKMQRKQYVSLRKASLCVQQRFRANKLMKKERENYLQIRKSAICLQQHFRANFLMKKQRNEFVALRNATIKIQNRFRANLLMKKQRSQYVVIRKAAIIIQMRFRAILLMKQEREAFLKLRKATISIQQHYRAIKLMRIQRNQFESFKKSTICIQRWYRGIKLMKTKRNEYLQLRNATIALQMRYRALVLMREDRERFITLHKATILIQRKFRANKLMSLARTDYLRLRHAAITIQRRYRAKVSMQLQRNHYVTLQKSVVCIQSHFKALSCKRKYSSLRDKTIVIQRLFRAKLLMKKQRADYLSIKNAATTFQRQYRSLRAMKNQRTEYLQLRKAAVKVQTQFKANRAAKTQRNHFVNLRNAAMIIQRRYRAKKAMDEEKNRYNDLKKAAVSIQSIFRAKILMRKDRKEFLNIRKNVINIQTYYRANILMKKQKLEFLKLKKTAILIQRRFRAILAMKKERDHYLKLRKATIRIQQQYRALVMMRKEKSEFQRLRNAAVCLQRRYRAQIAMRIERRRYLTLRNAAICLQERFRAKMFMRIEHMRYLRISRAVLCIQQYFRATVLMRMERSSFVQLRMAAVCIQQRFRATKMMKIEREKFLVWKSEESLRRKVQMVIIIQRVFRGHLVRKQYAPLLTKEAIEERKLEKKRKDSAVKIQAVWRGFRVRSASQQKLNVIRKRMEKANENAKPEQTLAHRRDQALNIITANYTSLLQIIRALEDLDFVIRRDKDTCFKMSGILCEQFYLMIATSTRSLPEMKATTIAASILISFIKYPPACQHAWLPENLDSIINVMIHCCDKESLLFPYLCTLLWSFAHEESHRTTILELPYFQKRFTKIQWLVKRMERMVKLGANKGLSVFVRSDRDTLPSLLPDWGIDYDDRPRAFKNSVFALESVCKILSL